LGSTKGKRNAAMGEGGVGGEGRNGCCCGPGLSGALGEPVAMSKVGNGGDDENSVSLKNEGWSKKGGT